MDLKSYYEWYNRDDPSSTYHPEDEVTLPHRLAWFLKHIPSGAKVLDYGCGEGVVLAGLSQRGDIDPDSWGVDISENAIKKSASRFPNLKFACTNPDGVTHFPSESFDAIVATEVIEHLFDADGAFREFHRLLRPSGRLLLSCPYHGPLKDLALLLTGKMDSHYHNPYSSHIRFYSPKTLRLVHEKNGFRILERSGVGRVSFLWKSMVTVAVKQEKHSSPPTQL